MWHFLGIFLARTPPGLPPLKIFALLFLGYLIDKIAWYAWSKVTNNRVSNIGCGNAQNRSGQKDCDWGTVIKFEDPIVRVDLVKLELVLRGGQQLGGHGDIVSHNYWESYNKAWKNENIWNKD